MIPQLKPWAAVSREERRLLTERLKAYYQKAPGDYYAEADRNRGAYGEPQMALHRRLLNGLAGGDRVLELGCGTAHLAPEVFHRGATYTGLDWSGELIQAHRRQMPAARFHVLNDAPNLTYDWVISLYTLEHVVDPPDYLSQMDRFCVPGGRVGILCPDFVRAGGAPSLVFGNSPLRIRQKIRAGRWHSACRHLWESAVLRRLWAWRANRLPPGQFWINVQPRIFFDEPYGIDFDAVHLPRQEDVENWFERRGYSVQQSRDRIHPFPARVPRDTIFLIARKPV